MVPSIHDEDYHERNLITFIKIIKEYQVEEEKEDDEDLELGEEKIREEIMDEETEQTL